MNRTLSTIVIFLAVVMIGILGLVFYLMLTDILDEETAATPTSEATEVIAAATETESPILPTSEVEIQPTDTVPPSPTPTETPLPTDTPVPTETPIPPTNTPVPVIIPTNPPPPPATPTNTPEPPPPPSTNGLVLNSFGLEGGPGFPVNQPIWFNFDIANISGGPVPFGALGVMPKKDGGDRLDWYQNSWGGNNDSIPPNGLVWRDNIQLPEGGSYTLRLVICFDSYQACIGGSGSFITLSQEVPITAS
jgi:hypothetical protein